MKTTIVPDILKELKANINATYLERSKNFFKENVRNMGISVPVLRSIAKKHYACIKGFNKKDAFSICEELLDTDFFEGHIIAFDWTYRIRKIYSEEDFIILERWLKKYVSNWATCDDFCTHALGYHLYSFPEYLPKAALWTRSKNMWLRRASAVSLIYSIRRNEHLDQVFLVSDTLMNDNEDLVQKGYGWLLKETSKHNLDEVYTYVLKNKMTMPRTALRYAIEKMPRKYKLTAMST
jgi:3-methyladenine DNA glycosylase AlkD